MEDSIYPGVPLSPPPLNIDIAAIVTATANAATQGIAAATAVNASAGTSATQTPLSHLKLLHLRMICWVATNMGIPTIWGEVATIYKLSAHTQ